VKPPTIQLSAVSGKCFVEKLERGRWERRREKRRERGDKE
jgi:hypothetical protein